RPLDQPEGLHALQPDQQVTTGRWSGLRPRAGSRFDERIAAAWMVLDQAWESWFPDDRFRMREYARGLVD
ncbi:MAG: hypothetical protein SYR96_37475, partial [Actinomycetota bacterium]|nr:hypothetical protein [Actinomycetota bacterium]